MTASNQTIATYKRPRQTSPGFASARRIVELAGRIAPALIAGALLIAILVGIALASPARGWLGYRFPGVPTRTADAVAIFAHNSRALLGVLGLLLIAQLAARAPDGPGRVQRAVQAGGELILAGMITANVLVVGSAIGAYRTEMVRAMLPHGPIELASYSLSLALYVQGRRRALPAHRLAVTVAISAGLLAIAAVLETSVNV